MQLFRSQKQLKAVEKDTSLLDESGTRYQLLNSAECLKQEPGLTNMQGKLAGGLYLPDDQTGDCHLFCQQLQALAQKAGVSFVFDTEIQKLNLKGQQIDNIETSKGRFTADKFVVALGSYSKLFLKQIGSRSSHLSRKGLLAHLTYNK